MLDSSVIGKTIPVIINGEKQFILICGVEEKEAHLYLKGIGVFSLTCEEVEKLIQSNSLFKFGEEEK